jgi:outer membrane immunogenic protein
MRNVDLVKTNRILLIATICATLIVAFSSAAQAQTKPGEPTVVQTTQSSFPSDPSWTGFYVGGHGGAAWNNYDISSFHERVDVIAQFYQELNSGVEGVAESGFSDFDLPRDNGGSNGRPTGGAQIGYNMQFGHFVVGLESSVSAASGAEVGRATGFAEKFFSGDGFNNVEGDTTLHTQRKVEMDWNATTELHLGYAWHEFMFYVLGGGAFARVSASTHDVASSDFFGGGGDVVGGVSPRQGGRFLGNVTNSLFRQDSEVLSGYTVGGGIAMALTEFVSVNLEYRHSDYGEETFPFGNSEFIVPGSNNIAVKSDQVLFKINLLLGHF